MSESDSTWRLGSSTRLDNGLVLIRTKLWLKDEKTSHKSYCNHHGHCRFLLDTSDDNVRFFVEWNKCVFAFNSSTVDHEVSDSTSDVVESYSATFQEFFLKIQKNDF